MQGRALKAANKTGRGKQWSIQLEPHFDGEVLALRALYPDGDTNEIRVGARDLIQDLVDQVFLHDNASEELAAWFTELFFKGPGRYGLADD